MRMWKRETHHHPQNPTSSKCLCPFSSTPAWSQATKRRHECDRRRMEAWAKRRRYCSKTRPITPPKAKEGFIAAPPCCHYIIPNSASLATIASPAATAGTSTTAALLSHPDPLPLPAQPPQNRANTDSKSRPFQ
jgi:hypothetical protein